MGTYSQTSKRAQKCEQGSLQHVKNLFMQKAFDEEKALLCDDEVHKASGEHSATGRNLQSAMRASGKVVAASATAVKNPRYVKYLSFLFDEYTDMDEYQQLLQKGGEAMQEVWAELLSKAGFMRRIENDNSQITFVTKKATASREKNLEIQTALAPIYSAMAQLSGEMNTIVTNQENTLQEREVANAVIDAAGGLVNDANRNEVRRARC